MQRHSRTLSLSLGAAASCALVTLASVSGARAQELVIAAPILNIANEWGPRDSAVWRDEYIDAVRKLRAAGYHATIMIDSGDCGQDYNDLVKYGRAVGEFGPGRNVGKSPTDVTPREVMRLAEDHRVGWMGWAWDDKPEPGVSYDDYYGMSYPRQVPNAFGSGSHDEFHYDSSADLTAFGKVVVEDPTYGLLRLAKPATGF